MIEAMKSAFVGTVLMVGMFLFVGLFIRYEWLFPAIALPILAYSVGRVARDMWRGR